MGHYRIVMKLLVTVMITTVFAHENLSTRKEGMKNPFLKAELEERDSENSKELAWENGNLDMDEVSTRSDWSEEELDIADDKSSEFDAREGVKEENNLCKTPLSKCVKDYDAHDFVENISPAYKNALNEF